jgi:predicted ATP-grasp superfamily ATP-dependent carboligase
MLQWAAESGCELVISAAGIPYEEGDGPKDDSPRVYAVGSTKKALKGAKDAGIPTLGSGSITGIYLRYCSTRVRGRALTSSCCL